VSWFDQNQLCIMLSVHHVNPLKDRHFQYNIASRLKSLFREKISSWQNYTLRCIIPQVFGLLIDIFYHVERTGEPQTFNALLLLAYDIHSTSYPTFDNTPNLCVLKLNCSYICSSILHYPYAVKCISPHLSKQPTKHFNCLDQRSSASVREVGKSKYTTPHQA